MKFPSFRGTAATLLFTTICLAPRSQGAVLFDNLDSITNGYAGVSNGQWAFQAFTTTATAYVLQQVSLLLYNPNGISGGYEIQIWDASGSGGAPGAQFGPAIFQGTAQSLGTTADDILTIDLSVTLSPETSYYFMARGTSLSDVADMEMEMEPQPGYLNWEGSALNESPSYVSVNGGGQFFGPFTSNRKMSVTAVPEPSAVLLSGLGTLCLMRRSRRRMP